MIVTVVNESQCMSCYTDFFPKHNLDAGLLARYAYGESLENGMQARLLMTIYDKKYRSEDIGVVEYGNKVYLYPMSALEEWRYIDG